jgi:AcrR family transcriptional regulator
MESFVQPGSRDISNTRQAILSQACSLFCAKGYAGTSMADLAQALGLSKAAIYHHFESKESILKNLVGSTFRDINAIVSEYEKLTVDKIDPREVLRRFAETVFIHKEVIQLVLSQLPIEMMLNSNEHSNFIARLQKILAGNNPTLESAMRARAATTVIATGFVPPPFSRVLESNEVDLSLLIEIAIDALKLDAAQTH